MKSTSSLSKTWTSYAANRLASRPVIERTRALENEVLSATRAIAQGKNAVDLFGKSYQVGRLNPRSINNILREEGSDLRLFMFGRETLLGRIVREELADNKETYFFGSDELFSTIRNNSAAMAFKGVIAVRRSVLASGLANLQNLISFKAQIDRPSLHLEIVSRAWQEFAGQEQELLVQLEELEVIHEKSHLARESAEAFKKKGVIPSVEAIDEILSDLEVIEFSLAKPKLLALLLAQSLTSLAGSKMNGDAVCEARYAFTAAILHKYLDSEEYRGNFTATLAGMRRDLLALAESSASSFSNQPRETIVRSAPLFNHAAIEWKIPGGIRIVLIEPEKIPALLEPETPQAAAWRPADLPPPMGQDELLARQALTAVRTMKTAAGAAAFLDLVPRDYRPRIVKMVEESYSSRGRGRTYTEFTEDMALYWLAQREAFNQMALQAGFEIIPEGTPISPNINSAILALTLSGSIVACTRPDPKEGGKREATYQRIPLRETADIAPVKKCRISLPAMIGRVLQLVDHLNTAPLICLATHPDADSVSLREQTRSFTGTSMTMAGLVWERDKP